MTNKLLSGNIKLLFFCIVTCFITYGFTLTNFSLSIDSEQQFASYTFLDLGRWGISLIRFHIFHGIIPYFTLLLGLLVLSLSAVEMSKFLRLNTLQSYIFCALFLTSPQMSYQLVFTLQADAIPIGILAGVLAMRLFINVTALPFSVKSAVQFAIASLLIMFALAIYQALIFIPAILMTIHLLQDTYSDEYSAKTFLRKVLLFLGLAVASAVLYVLSVKIITPNANTGGYLGSYSSGGSGNRFTDFFKLLISNLMGKTYYGGKTFALCAVIVLILAVVFTLKDRKKLPVRLLLLAGLLVVPFLISFFITNGYNPPRLYVASGVVLAFLTVQFTGLLKREQIGILLSAFIVVVHVYFITCLFVSHHNIFEHDKELARKIDTEIHKKSPEFDAEKDYVYFFGSVPYSEHDRFRLENSEIFGGSFFFWDNGSNNRIINFFRFTDVAYYKEIDNKETFTAIQDSIAPMPIWPKEGAVKRINNVMVVKLGETKGSNLAVE